MNSSAFEEAATKEFENAVQRIYKKLSWDLYGQNNDDPFFTNETLND